MTNRHSEQKTQRLCAAASFASEGFAEVQRFWEELFHGTFEVEWAGYGQMLPAMLDRAGAWRRAAGPKLLFVRATDPVLKEEDFLSALGEMCVKTAVAVILCPIVGHSDDAAKKNLSTVPGLEILDGHEAMSLYHVEKWWDEIADTSADTPYTEEGFAALFSQAMRFAIPLNEKPVKLIAVDADNTLWDGVIGEDGPDGIRFNDGHRALHHRLVSAAKAGKIIAIVSKNNPEDLEKAWSSELVNTLPKDAILSIEASWEAKSAAIGRLLDLYEVEPASAIFLDDNPVECAEIKAVFPSLRTIKVPHSTQIEPFVSHLWGLDGRARTEADANRLASYRSSADRKRAQESATDLKQFFSSLELKIEISEATSADYDRVMQLSARTTQFNAAPKILQLLDLTSRQSSTLAVRVSDRFGDYGLVGVLRYRLDEFALNVSVFLLSCRALGRGVEYAMLSHIGMLAQHAGLPLVKILVQETDRNLPMRNFLYGLKEHQALADGIELDSDVAAGLIFSPGTEDDARYGAKGKGRSTSTASRFDRGEVDEFIATRYVRADALLSAIEPPKRMRPEELGACTPPQGEAERTIVSAFEEVLRLAPIGRADNWHAMGAKSIHLVRIHSILTRALGIDFDIAALFRVTTASELSQLLFNNDHKKISNDRTQRMGRAAAAVAARRKRARGQK